MGMGKIDNHDQEPWKAPLPQFIECLYEKRFGRERPETVVTMEERIRRQQEKREARKEERNRRRETEEAAAAAQGSAGEDAACTTPLPPRSPGA